MSSNVQFDEDSFSYGNSSTQSARPVHSTNSGPSNPSSNVSYSPVDKNAPKMSQFLMRHGLAKSDTVAQLILVAIVIINAAVAYYIFKYLV